MYNCDCSDQQDRWLLSNRPPCQLTEAVMTDGVWQDGAPDACCAAADAAEGCGGQVPACLHFRPQTPEENRGG